MKICQINVIRSEVHRLEAGIESSLIEIIVENGPISIADIHTKVGDNLTRRQLRIRIKKLLDSKSIKMNGRNKGAKYEIVPQVKEDIPFCDLLESYVPNQTFFLSADERRQLLELGRTLETLPGGTYRQEVHERILVDLSWASSHLEGSTYTLLDTKNLIEVQHKAKGKPLREAQMILNHKRAIEFILEGHGLKKSTVKNLHAILMDGLLTNPGDGGRLRKRPVAIIGSTFIPLSDPHRMLVFFEKIITIANQIIDVYERSFFLLVNIPYLQPFLDGNKRTARLACNIPLVEQNLVPLTFIDITPSAYADATITQYETHDRSKLKAMYIRAYHASAARFREAEELAVMPNMFRIAHREIIYKTVAEIVADNKDAEPYIKMKSTFFDDPNERRQFIEIVAEDLSELHEGNFMRYRITPNQYEKWKSMSV